MSVIATLKASRGVIGCGGFSEEGDTFARIDGHGNAGATLVMTGILSTGELHLAEVGIASRC